MKMKTSKRYRILSDDDGHDYLILVGEENQFQEWLDAGPYWEGYDGKDYDGARINGAPSRITFVDPKED